MSREREWPWSRLAAFLSGNNPGVAAYQKLLFALRCYKDIMYVVCLLFKAGTGFVVTGLVELLASSIVLFLTCQVTPKVDARADCDVGHRDV